MIFNYLLWQVRKCSHFQKNTLGDAASAFANWSIPFSQINCHVNKIKRSWEETCYSLSENFFESRLCGKYLWPGNLIMKCGSELVCDRRQNYIYLSVQWPCKMSRKVCQRLTYLVLMQHWKDSKEIGWFLPTTVVMQSISVLLTQIQISYQKSISRIPSGMLRELMLRLVD